MNRILRLAAILMVAVLASCTSSSHKSEPDKPVIITQVSFSDLTRDNAQGYLEDLKKADVSVVLLSLCIYYETGARRDSTMAKMKEAISFFEKEGFEVGVWTSSLGYGGKMPPFDEVYPEYQRLVNFDGNSCGAACTTDKKFLELIKDNIRDFAKAGAKFILMDDELVQSVRPGFTCVCPGHLAMLKEATGKDFTREQVRDLFSGAPSADRTAFLDVMGKSMEDFCKGLREAADEVNPDIVMAICSSYTHFDAEGVDMENLSRILAGKGHKPFLRLSGATYWPATWPHYPGVTLGDVVDFVRMQIGWLRGRDIILFDENDPSPRRVEIVPEPWCELYDKVMIANGGVNRHKYFLCYDPETREGREYLEAHFANMEDDKVLMDMFMGTSPCGFRVWNSEHLLRDINLPDKYPGNGDMMVRASRSAGAVFLTANSIPVCYEGSGFPGIAFGDQARLLSSEAIGNGLILDVPAALALQSKGIDVGLEEAVPVPDSEGLLYGLVPRKDTEARTIGDRCILCKTKDGLFAIYGWDGYGMLFREPRPWNGSIIEAQLKELYKEMSGGKDLPVSLRDDAPGIYLLPALSKDGKRLSVLVCNMVDSETAPVLEVPAGWEVSRTLRTEAAPDKGGGLALSAIPKRDWCAVEFKKAGR